MYPFLLHFRWHIFSKNLVLTTSQIPVTDEFFYSPHLSSYERVGILERILVAISTNDGFDVSHYNFIWLFSKLRKPQRITNLITRKLVQFRCYRAINCKSTVLFSAMVVFECLVFGSIAAVVVSELFLLKKLFTENNFPHINNDTSTPITSLFSSRKEYAWLRGSEF